MYRSTIPHVPLEDLNEEIVIDDVPMQGHLPLWLEGTLVRNGPAKFHFRDKTIGHWFDGLAMLHAFTFGQGKISYRNKFLRSTIFSQATEHDDLRFMGFAQDPCWTIFQRMFNFFLPSLTPQIIQNANVNVMRIAENYVALTETPLPVRFDPETLETLGVLEYRDRLQKQFCFESAHPHHDFLRNECVSYQIDFGVVCHYNIYKVADQGLAKREPFFSMKTDRASYMHSFAITNRYVVLVEYPLVLSPLDILLRGGGFITQFQWLPQRNTRFHVIDRSKGILVKSFETSPFFAFHHVNAFEEKDTIVVDLVSYPDPQIVFGPAPLDQVRQLERFRLNLADGSLAQDTLAESLMELPRIYYQKYNTQPYRYVYGVGFKYPTSEDDSIPIIKIDVETGSIQEWKEPSCLAGEPVFVPTPDGVGEDDGVLLSVVTGPTKGRSFLMVLDARDLSVIARAEVSHRIPYGLHGMFFHTSQAASSSG